MQSSIFKELPKANFTSDFDFDRFIWKCAPPRQSKPATETNPQNKEANKKNEQNREIEKNRSTNKKTMGSSPHSSSPSSDRKSLKKGHYEDKLTENTKKLTLKEKKKSKQESRTHHSSRSKPSYHQI